MEQGAATIILEPRISFILPHGLHSGSNITDAFYSTYTSLRSTISYTNHGITHVKEHGGELRQVYRLKLPPNRKLNRDYVIKHLPRLNLSGKIVRIGEHPTATNGAFGDVWQGRVNGRKVAVKVMRTRMAKETEKMEKVLLYDKSAAISLNV